MAQEPLSPCPECGGEARLDKNVQLRFRGAPAKGSGKRFSRVRCLEPDCGFATKKFKPEKGENNKKLYAKATTCWERFCKEKKEGCLITRQLQHPSSCRASDESAL